MNFAISAQLTIKSNS